MIDFIGIGAQKSGTSWVYACLYEHPEICAPIKEIHFFSRSRFSKGKEWYENHFRSCDQGRQRGEFSTSYLYSEEAAVRIKDMYPSVKLIVILRHPASRAYSHYQNAIKAGEIVKSTSFEVFAAQEPSVIAQGLYTKQLRRYFKLFPKEQMLILMYEDSKKDPRAFIKQIYSFLGVDTLFVPSMLFSSVNVARTPKAVWVDRVMHHIAEFLRKKGLHKMVWHIRNFGIPDIVRSFNTQEKKAQTTLDLSSYNKYFKDDVRELNVLLERDVTTYWNI